MGNPGYTEVYFTAGISGARTINVKQEKIILVEDDPEVRDVLRLLLSRSGYEVEEFGSGEALLETYEPASSFCALLDVNLPGMSGLEVQQLLKEKDKQIQVIFLTGHGEVPLAVAAMRAGAVDFIVKPANASDMLEVIERARTNYAKSVARQVSEAEAIQRIASLTVRELEVFERVAIGKQNKEVAFELQISPRTVEIYRARVMSKLEADNLSELIRVAIAGSHYPG